MTSTESIGRFGEAFYLVLLYAFGISSGIIAFSWHSEDADRREMSAIANDSANWKAHERTVLKIGTARENGSRVPSASPTVPAVGKALVPALRPPHVPPLRSIQEDAWPTLAPAFSASAHAAATTSVTRSIAANVTSATGDTPIRRRPVEPPSNPTPRDLSGLPIYRLSRTMTDGATTAMEEAEDIITTVTFRRNDPRNKVDLTHPISICVEYPDAADHARSCGSANWMAPEADSLTIDVVMPRRNTNGEPYARFGQNITCHVTYYDETNGAHMVMTTDQWNGGDCGAVAMIVAGGQP